MGGKSGGDATIGFRYYFALHMGICRGPVNELVEIRVADKTAFPTLGKDAVVVDPTLPVHAYIPASVSAAAAGEGFPQQVIYLYFTPPAGLARSGTITLEGTTRRVLAYQDAPDQISIDGDHTVMGIGEDYIAITADANFMTADLWCNGTPLDPNGKILIRDTNGGTPGSYTPPVAASGKIEGSGRIILNKGDLFGGDAKEGGIEGQLEVMMGYPNQVPHPDMTTWLGGPRPGYRGIFTLLFDGLIMSNNPYPKAWKFRTRRTTKGWDGPVFLPEFARIDMSRPTVEGEVTSSAEIHAANPAHIIFECLTNREWGRGLARSELDIPSFEKAARTLHGENFGLCLAWKRTDSIEVFVQNVIDHIGGVLFQHRGTALMNLRLIRSDYVRDDLPLYTDGAGLLAVTDASVGSTKGYASEVQVVYHDPITNEDRISRAQNLAVIQAMGGSTNAIKKTYMGIPTPNLALRVAERDLRAASTELRRYNITLDRRAWEVHPGDVLRIANIVRNIPDTVVRVARVEDGNLSKGDIRLTVVQDVFGFSKRSYGGNQGSLWTPPNINPCVGRHEVFELPYGLLVPRVSAADLSFIHETSAYYGVVMEQGQPLNASYSMAVRSGGSTADDMPTTSTQYCGYVPPSNNKYTIAAARGTADQGQSGSQVFTGYRGYTDSSYPTKLGSSVPLDTKLLGAYRLQIKNGAGQVQFDGFVLAVGGVETDAYTQFQVAYNGTTFVGVPSFNPNFNLDGDIAELPPTGWECLIQSPHPLVELGTSFTITLVK